MAGKFRSVLLFGAPGSGKGTQGTLLGQVPGFVHMASGDIFRSLDNDSRLGKKFLEYSTKGLLVPDDVTIEVVQNHVNRRVEDGTYRPDVELLILDGVPRNVSQCKALDPVIDVLRVVHLKAPDVEAMVQRLKKRAQKQGRPDDADESVIRRRFKVYDEETSPVLGYYHNGLIRDVAAIGQPAEVLQKVLDAIIEVYRGQFGNPLGSDPI
jgi:adenylate kinase